MNYSADRLVSILTQAITLMWDRILPRQFDNRLRGHRWALWLFYPIALMEILISLAAIFSKDGEAQSADGIPLDTFTAAGAQAVIGVVAFLGLASLLLGILFLLAAFRYRSMIPLMYILLLADYLGHKGINLIKPIPRTAAASGSYVSLGLFILTLIGFLLSLLPRNSPPARVDPGEDVRFPTTV